MKLFEVGLDSLAIVELKTKLEREFSMQVSIDELKNMKFSKFIKVIGLNETVMLWRKQKILWIICYKI